MPQGLAQEQDPMSFLYHPKYRIVIDSIDTNCLMYGFRNLVWCNGDQIAAFEAKFTASGRKESVSCVWEQGHVILLLISFYYPIHYPKPPLLPMTTLYQVEVDRALTPKIYT